MEVNAEEVRARAFLITVSVFVVSICGVLLLAFLYDFSTLNLSGLLFLLAFLCCVLIAKNVYDVSSIAPVADQPMVSRVLEANQSMYLQLYQKSPIPYFMIDTVGVITSANTAAARLLGVQQKRVIGINIFEIIETSSVEHKDTLIKKYTSGVGVSDELVRLRRSDHREVWGLLSLFQFVASNQEPQGLLTLVDITKQKKAEDAKSDFVSLASHQLRTPLAGMKWSAELLEMDSLETLTQRQRKYMDRLLESIARMSVLVDDFLRVSRFELGNFTADYQPVDLPQLLAAVIEELDAKIKQKNLVLQTDFDPAIITIVSDPNLLRMAMTNLYGNAIKYTPTGGSVRLSYQEVKGLLKIEVADSGIGIPQVDQEYIFSKLFRATNARRDVPDGTGLGLYIVREAVSVLRGKVTFTSIEGQGTVFTVHIPLEAVE
jgi:PAS domain S-box-containing protein